MPLTLKTTMNVELKDVPGGIEVEQAVLVQDNTVGLVMVDDTYVLPASMLAYIEIAKGDIVTMKSISIIVIQKGGTFLGVGVNVAASLPTTAVFTVMDLLNINGSASDKVWIKNLDDAECTVRVIMTGLNA